MSLLDEAVTKYNKLLESGPYRDLSWAEALHERMESEEALRGRTPDLSLFASEFYHAPAIRFFSQDRRIADRRHRPHGADGAREPRAAGAARIAAGGEDAGLHRSRLSAAPKSRRAWLLIWSTGICTSCSINADSPSGAGYADALSNMFWERRR